MPLIVKNSLVAAMLATRRQEREALQQRALLLLERDPDVAAAWLERALQQEPDPAAPARLPALLGIGNLAYALQDLKRAHDAYTAYHALACDRQEAYHIAAALGSLGHVAKARGNLPLARALREDSLYRFQQLGDTRNIALTLANLATAEGAFAAAQAEHTQALALFRTVEDAPNIVLALNNLAHDALLRNDTPTAIATLRESLRLANDTHSHFGMMQALLQVTMLAAQGKREPAAAKLLGYVEQQLQQYHTPFGPEERARIQEVRQRLADVLGEDAFLLAYDRGRALQTEQIILLAEAELRASV